MSVLANSNAIDNANNAISNSLRFQSASTQYLSRTPSSTGTGAAKTWTYSAWVKRGKLGATQYLFAATTDAFSVNYTLLYFSSGDVLWFEDYQTSLRSQMITTQVFRDPSAWYHIVLAVDTTQATSTNRYKLYVNGQQVTAFSTATYYAQNQTTLIDNTAPNYIGGSINNFDGYIANVNFIDGQALTPSSFGTTNPVTGQWVATGYSGSYGTNGFYLPFVDGTSTATLGVDYSGNKNNWNLINFTRSAGVSDCWMYDVPANNTGAGLSAFQPASNYAVLNPLNYATTNSTITNGNLTWTTNTTSGPNKQGITIPFPNTGKWYAEFVATQVNIGGSVGYAQIALSTQDLTSSFGFLWWVYSSPFYQISNGSTYATIPTISSGDVIMMAVDIDAGKCWFGQNGTWLLSGNPATGTNMSNAITFTANRSDLTISITGRTGSATNIVNANFGQRPFAYTPPTGFKALCTTNLPDSTIVKGNQYMDATLYTGTGANQTIVNAGGFSPDFVWMKGRSNVRNNNLYDAVRGVTKELTSNTTGAESTNATGLTAFNSNGWSIGTDGGINTLNETYVGWQWDAGSSTVTNTSGTISSQVRANPTAGVSVVTYTGNSTSGATIGHGLGIAPKMIITKTRNTTLGNWGVYHESLGNTKGLNLNTTVAAFTGAAWWNNTTPTSSVFTVGNGNDVNGASTYVAYCFAEIAGFSKFGSYTGNGSADGPMIFTGFAPKYWLVKRTDSADDWFVFDSSREPYNTIDLRLCPNGSYAEASTTTGFDFLANGVKVRSSSAAFNASGGTYIYMAFAESPFSISNAR